MYDRGKLEVHGRDGGKDMKRKGKGREATRVVLYWAPDLGRDASGYWVAPVCFSGQSCLDYFPFLFLEDTLLSIGLSRFESVEAR